MSGVSQERSERSAWSARATLVSVRDLDQSTAFYQDVMGLSQVTRQDQIAVLGREPSGRFEVVLREAQRGAHPSGQQAMGLRVISFDVGSFEELDRVEQILRERQAFTVQGSIGPSRSFEYVRGLDPDRQALIFLAYVAGMEFSAAHYEQIIGSMYSVDL